MATTGPVGVVKSLDTCEFATTLIAIAVVVAVPFSECRKTFALFSSVLLYVHRDPTDY